MVDDPATVTVPRELLREVLSNAMMNAILCEGRAQDRRARCAEALTAAPKKRCCIFRNCMV